MSQALASLQRNFTLLFACLFLVACNGSYTAFESDRDFDVDRKTSNIELDNAELKMLGALQAAFFAHYQSPVFDFLDASDLPTNSSPTSSTNPNQFFCDTGTVDYSFTRPAGNPHQVGDRVSVNYDNCRVGSKVYDGSMAATYTKLRGLNDQLVNISSSECIENLQETLSIGFSDTVYFSGDAVRFTKVSNLVYIEIYLFENEAGESGTQQTETLKQRYEVTNTDKVIVVLHPRHSVEGAITSVNGDQIYSLIDGNNKLEQCQAYERTLSVSFNDFSSSSDGFLKTIFNGSVTLLEAQEVPGRLNQSFVDSDFTTTVIQENSRQVFRMSDYTVERAVNLNTHAYAYEFSGFIRNAGMLGGQMELTNAGKLLGTFDGDYPTSGALELKGRGLERVNLLPENMALSIQVDFNGDSSGNGFSDIDAFIDTNWLDLLERNFKE